MNPERDRPETAPSKSELLIQMSNLQNRCGQLLLKGNEENSKAELKAASHSFSEYVECMKNYINVALFHNQIHPNPIDVTLIVQPLVNILFILADTYQSLGQSDKIDKLHKEAANLSEKYLGDLGRAEAERSRVASLLSRGEINEALSILNTAKQFFLKINNIHRYLRCSLDFLDILNWLGDYSRALNEIESSKGKLKMIISPESISFMDRWKKIVENQEKLAQQNIKLDSIDKQLEQVRQLVEINYYQGLIHKNLGNYQQAENHFKKVLPFYQSLGVGPSIEYQIADILVKKKELTTALEYIDRIEHDFKSNELLRPKLAVIYKVKAEAFFYFDKKPEALKLLQSGINDLLIYYDPEALWQLYWLKGKVLSASNQKKQALKSYYEGIKIINNLRKATLGFRLDNTYLANKLGLVNDAILLCNEIQEPEIASELIESVKSRALSSLLTIPAYTKSEHTKNYEERFNSLTKRIDALFFIGHQNGWTVELRTQHKAFLKQRNEIIEQIRYSDPRWRNLTASTQFEISKIREIIKKNNLSVLNLYYVANKVITILISKEYFLISEVDFPKAKFFKLRKYENNLRQIDAFSQLNDISTAYKLEIQDFIQENLISKALEAEKLLIIPHSLFHLVPWAGIKYKEKRIFEFIPVGILPNLNCLFFLKTNFTNIPAISLIGPPSYQDFQDIKELKYAQLEIEEIKIMNQKGSQRKIISPLKGPELTKESFIKFVQQESESSEILHIACHGETNSNNPMGSALLLTNSKIDAAQISRLSLNYKEVILSSCSSGYRPYKTQEVHLIGDDILGIPGAFLEAGARSILVSIPLADDEASFEFMVEYHKHRLGNKSPLNALQATQIDMLQKPHLPIHLWIGFTIYGIQ